MDVLRPGSVDELSAALRDAHAAGRRVGIAGAGTKAGWVPAGEPVDVTIATTGLSALVEHAVGDLVVTVEAGLRLRDLQEQLGRHGQWLALDPPETEATVGGVVAAGASGPRRLRFGTPRDLVLGMTIVLADGTVARSGGKVVKNVAGYDLARLFTGSFGTLGVIATVTLRLHPVLLARRVVSVAAERPAGLVGAVRRSPVAPTALEWDGRQLVVVVESSEAAVDAQAELVRSLVGGAVADDLPVGFGDRPWRVGELGLKVTHRLGALEPVLDDIARLAPDVRISAHAGSGVLWLALAAQTPPSLLEDLRRCVAAYDGSVVAVEVPDALRDAIDVWGPVRGLDVMARVKEQFDPDRRLNPGRFVGGL